MIVAYARPVTFFPGRPGPRPVGPRRLAGGLRLLLGLATLAMFLLVPAAPAAAHTGLVGSTPDEGSVVSAAPAEVRLTFGGQVDPVESGFVLYSADGQRRPLSVTAAENVVGLAMPELVEGSYAVTWRVVSEDLHPLAGVLTFAVGERSANPPVVESGAATPASVGSWYLAASVAGYLALITAIGITLFEHLVLQVARRGSDAGTRGRGRTVGAAALVAVAAYLLLLPLTRLREVDGPLDQVFAGPVWREAADSPVTATLGLVLLGLGGMLAARRLRGRVGSALALGSALVAAGSVLPTGHTRTYSPAWLVVAADLVHTLAAAAWFGGVIGLGWYLRRSRASEGDAVTAAGVVTRFSTLAGVLVVALGASGVALGAVILQTPAALLGTDYGRTLLVKLALVAVVAVLALWNKANLVAAVSRRGTAPDQWRRLVGAVRDEAVILVLILGVTGLLVMQSPAVSPGPSSSATSADGPATAVSATFGNGTLRGRVSPGRVGDNVVELELRDASGGPLQAAELPTAAAVSGSAPGPVAGRVEAVAPGRYRVTLELPTPGVWRVTVSAREADGATRRATVPITARG